MRQVRAGVLAKQEEYWLDQFKDDIPVIDLPTDFPRSSAGNPYGTGHYREIAPDVFQRVKDFVLEREITLNIFLLAAYTILLSKYTGQEDIVVGSLVTGRSHTDLQQIIGLFLNTVPLRVFPAPDKTVRHYLREVKETTLRGYENQDYPLNELVWKLGIRRDAQRNPLFDTIFTMQNLELPEVEIEGLILKSYSPGKITVKFDLYFDAVETGDGLALFFKYSTALYRAATIERMVDHFIDIIRQVLDDPGQKLKDIRVSYDLMPIESHGFLEEDSDFGLD